MGQCLRFKSNIKEGSYFVFIVNSFQLNQYKPLYSSYKISQLICTLNKLNDFYMTRILFLIKYINVVVFNSCLVAHTF